MPVEIRELVIRAVVAPPDAGSASESATPMTEREREALVAECVEQVLRALERAQER